MNGTCTCGVELVEGARFCHKCGRPVDGFSPVEEETPPPLPAATQPVSNPEPAATAAAALAAAAATEFENRTAVRAGMIAAALTFLPAMVLSSTIGAPFMALAPVVTGSLAVFLHSHRTGRTLTLIEGARQGWISGLFFFLIVLVLLTLIFVVISNNADMIPLIREQAKAKGNLTPETSQMLEQMQQPGQFAGTILMTSLLSFVLFTSLSSLGGILGTRLFGGGGARRAN